MTLIKHNWSEYQNNIFSNIKNDNGNLIIVARSGCGKTKTLIEASKYLPKDKTTLFCAFNKSIQLELKDKLKHNVKDCLTLHSLGFRAIKNKFGNVELDNNKCWDIVSEIVANEPDNFELISSICKTVNLCKARLIDTPTKIDKLISEFDIDLCDVELENYIKYVSLTLRLCKEKKHIIDYSDMIWFCFVYGIKPSIFDNLFIDECQDLSRAQIELALSAVRKNGRIIAVLDDRQVLYGFAGVEINVLDILRQRLNPKELTLPICYRCPTKIITLAQKYVPDILPTENAIEGTVKYITFDEFYNYVKPNSYVLSRINAPLIKHCLTLIKRGVKANILGRDIGDGLNSIVKKSKKKNIKSFLEWLSKWEKSEKERMLIKNPKSDTEIISDKVECLHNLCEGCSSLEDIKRNINIMFKDVNEKDIVLLSSIHRVKGKESDTVFILEDTLRYNNDISENNCNYVAITRARKELYFVRKRKE